MRGQRPLTVNSNQPGSCPGKPSTPASGLNGRYIPMATTARHVASNGPLGRLRSGFLEVRMMKTTRVCVASDSTN